LTGIALAIEPRLFPHEVWSQPLENSQHNQTLLQGRPGTSYGLYRRFIGAANEGRAGSHLRACRLRVSSEPTRVQDAL